MLWRLASRATSLGLLTGALVVAFPVAARADCAAPLGVGEALAEAEAVFVGKVVETDFDGRLATFDVVEIWKGAVEETAVVNGGPPVEELLAARAAGQELFSSVDRSFGLGETYLVASHDHRASVFLDNGCSSTQLFTAAVEAFRPETAREPVGVVPVNTPHQEPSGPNWSLLALLASVPVALAGAWRFKGRRKDERYQIW